MRHNPLSTYIREDINAFESAMKHKIANWHVMIANNNVKIETFDKRQLSIQGVGYSGTLVTQYWSFFDPFIQDYISTKSKEIRIKSIDMHIDTPQSLKIFRDNMQVSIRIIYNKIAETDRLMRGKGFPDNVSLVPVDTEIKHMEHYLDEKIDAQIDIANRYKSCKRKEFILEHMSWWISIIVLLGGFLCEKMGWIEFGNWLRKIQDNF